MISRVDIIGQNGNDGIHYEEINNESTTDKANTAKTTENGGSENSNGTTSTRSKTGGT